MAWDISEETFRPSLSFLDKRCEEEGDFLSPFFQSRRGTPTMLGFLMLLLGALTQVVFVGQQPTKTEMDKFCNSERVRPNLELQHQTRVSGRVTDIAGVPFKNSRVELRRYNSECKQVTITVSTTDDKGDFDLGQVEKGEYRLLASPTRIFKQPEELHCPRKECKLTIALQANPTDLPESGCPIQ
jgi:hypothetical protein